MKKSDSAQTVSSIEVRPAETEERITLGVVQRGQGPFVLVPVRYKDELRYALAAKRVKDGDEFLQLLAICINVDLDRDIIVSLDEVVASPLIEMKQALN